MTQRTIAPPPVRRLFPSIFLSLFALALTMLAPACQAQAQPASRIAGAIDASTRVPIKGSVSPRIASATDQGRVSGNLKLEGLTLVFTPTAAQQTDLQQLLVDQQTPGSSNYHVWLTPAEYAARFGMSEADLAKVSEWLTSQGFTVAGANNSRTRITFSGTAGQVESAFATELHHYSVNGETHLANATALQVPAALAGIASGVGNISDFRPKPRVRSVPQALAPRYTSSLSGSIFVAPSDLGVIYDIAPLYAAGYTGSGQRIAVVGQSEVLLADIANFRAAAGLAAKAPISVLVPNTGTATVYSGDEGESDIDLEYSGAIAQNADIYFVFTGSDQNTDVFDALDYAVDTDLAPVISISYGNCEANFSTAEFTQMEQVFEQANSQGQTIFSAAGDSGATDCDDSGTTTATTITSATHGLAVDYPASSQYVTGVGGTMFNEGSATSTYWATTNTANGGSALSYIPEAVWNETAAAISAGIGGLTGGGGGASTLTAKPSWQTGTGVPADGHRDVPDIALDAALVHEGLLYCSSDADSTSCTAGFRDASQNLTVAGGTSFGAPIAAGIFTLINQKTSAKGQGNLNPTLYSLAASTPAGFHDITVGNNSQPCTIGSTGCTTSPIGFSAGVGYDQASGLGTLDVSVLAGGFPAAATSSLIATTLSLSPSNSTVTSGTSTTITATVVGITPGSSTPTGTVQFAVDGVSTGAAVPLSGSIASYTLTSAILTSVGSHVISATYSGDSVFATSYAVDTITITAAPSTGIGTFALSSSAATTALGGTGTSTITVTPAAGYTGTVGFTLASGNTATTNALGSDFCYDIGNAIVANATTPATASLTLYTTLATCENTVSPAGRPLHKLGGGSTLKTLASTSKGAPKPGLPELPVSAAAIAGAVCLLVSRRRSRLLSQVWMLAAVVLLSGAALGAMGCGGSSGTPAITPQEVPAGTYSLVVTGADTTYSSIPAATTTVTFTVQ